MPDNSIETSSQTTPLPNMTETAKSSDPLDLLSNKLKQVQAQAKQLFGESSQHGTNNSDSIFKLDKQAQEIEAQMMQVNNSRKEAQPGPGLVPEKLITPPEKRFAGDLSGPIFEEDDEFSDLPPTLRKIKRDEKKAQSNQPADLSQLRSRQAQNRIEAHLLLEKSAAGENHSMELFKLSQEANELESKIMTLSVTTKDTPVSPPSRPVVENNPPAAPAAEPAVQAEQAEAPGQPEAIQILGVKDNPDIPRRAPSQVTFQQDNAQVHVLFNGHEWYKTPGIFKAIDVDGKTMRIIYSPTESGFYFNPVTDVYELGQAGLNLSDQNLESFKTLMQQAITIDEYFSLSEADQRNLNDLILQNPELSKAFAKFTSGFYGDPLTDDGDETLGQILLSENAVNNKPALESILTRDGGKGLKDTRSLILNTGSGQQEVFAGLTVAEFLKGISMLETEPEVFNQIARLEKNKRGGVSLKYDALAQAYSQIQNDPTLKQAFDKLGIFKNNNQTFSNNVLTLLAG